MKINTVITAIGNKKVNTELKEKNVNIIANDIQYKEGILEYLEINKNINYLIINEELDGNIKIEELISNINKINNKIKIILINNKNINKNIKVFKKIEEFNCEKIIKAIQEKNNEINNNEINNDEINNNKINNNKINNSKINNNKIFNKKIIPINNLFNKIDTKDGKIITILGPNGIGKSIFSIVFANNIKNKKILIIDFDVLNNSLHTLLGVNEYSKKIQKNIKKNNLIQENINICDFIINTKFNIDLISGINLIFDSKYQISSTKIKNIISKIKNNYDLIIIDTSSECFLDYTKELIKISNNSIFISGANLLEINKSKKLLEIYTQEWGENKSKFNIVFNKCTKQSVDDEILRNLFNKYNILGKIKLSDYYDLAINNNNSKIKEIQKDLENIKKEIMKIKK